ncbi:MAG: HAD-IIIC family phosphatase [Desulforhopalus sp.]
MKKDIVEILNSVKDIDSFVNELSILDIHSLNRKSIKQIYSQLDYLGPRGSVKVAVLGSFTLDFIAEGLKLAFASLGFKADIYIAPYGQFYQEVLNPESELFKFSPDIIFLAVNPEDLVSIKKGDFEFSIINNGQQIKEDVLSRVSGWLNALSSKIQCRTIISNFITNSSSSLGIAVNSQSYCQKFFLSDLNKELATLCQTFPSTSVLDVDSLASYMGHKYVFDAKLYYMAKMLWSVDFLNVVAFEICKYFAAEKGMTKKCIVLDLDNTLWGGVVGEDGPEGIKVGSGDPISEAYNDFQIKLKELKNRGILLALCSKNNAQDALDAFELRKNMPLSLNDFAIKKINWNPKSQNIFEIAEELNIGLESLIFVDDNPAEIAQIKSVLPELTSILLPSQHEAMKSIFDSYPFLEKLKILDADRNKTAQYRQEAERNQLKRSAPNLNDYLSQLEITLNFREAAHTDLERIHQLFNKTNQFNLTTKRYTQAQVEQFNRSSDHILLCFDTGDKYGDMGTVGVVLISMEDGPFIDSFLLSCRAMGRGIEKEVFRKVFDLLLTKKNIPTIIRSLFIPTKKNIPASDFYESLGFEVIHENENKHKLYSITFEKNPIQASDWIKHEG